MDASFWGAEDGVLRGFLIREESFDDQQVTEFFKHRIKRKDASRWQILRWLGVPQERTTELRACWREVGPLVNLLHREIEALPETVGSFTWAMLCDGKVSALAMRSALGNYKIYKEEGLKTTPAQILVAGEHITPEAFVAYVSARKQVILECKDCHGRSWLTDFSAEETYICDGCMGELDKLKQIDRFVAQMVDNDDLVAITPKEIIGDFEVGQPLMADATGQLYQDSECEQQLIKLLSTTGQPNKDALREYRMFLGKLRQLDDSYLVPALRLASDEERFFLVFEAPAGRSLVGHPDPPKGQQALQVIYGLARGLAAVHRAGLVHGSMRPANVWIPEDEEIPACLIAAGEGLQPGLATLPDDIFLPAQVKGPADLCERSDLYGIGVMLVWLLSGKLPDPANPALALKVLDPEEGKIVARLLLEEEPYARATDLLHDLRLLLGENTPGLTPRGTRRRRRPSTLTETRRGSSSRNPSGPRTKSRSPGKGKGKPPILWIGLGAVLLLAIGLATFFNSRKQQPTQTVDKRPKLNGSNKGQKKPAETSKPPTDAEARRDRLLLEAEQALDLGQLAQAQRRIKLAAGTGHPEGLLWNLTLRRLSTNALVVVLRAASKDRSWDSLGVRAGTQLNEKNPERLEQLANSAKRDAQQKNTPAAVQIPLWTLHTLLRPDDFRAYLNRGHNYSQLYKTELALADYNTALKLEPGDWKVLNNRAVVYRNQGKWAKAIADHNKSMANVDRKDNFYKQALVNRGVTYLLAGQTTKAVADLTEIAGTTKNPYVHLALALANAANGQSRESAEAIKGYLRLRPGQLLASMGAGRSHLEFCTRMASLLPKHPLPLAERASLLLKLGNKPRAAEDLRRAVKLAQGEYAQFRAVVEQLLAQAQ